jgi:hypothetical protein
MKFKVVDGNTGGLVSEQDICSVTDHENLQGFGYTNTSPHHSIFGVIEGSPGTGILDRWEGWRVYVIIFNHNTGGFSVGQIDGPDDYPEGSWDTGMNWLFYSADNRHWNNAGGDEYIGYRHNILGIVNENPDSGAGFARIFARCIVTHTNLGAPWPFDHWTYVYGINGTVSMGGDISVEPWTDIIHNDDDERITQQESEGWMENQLKTTYGQCVGTPGDILPTFSRNISNTPIGSYAFKGDYDTNNFELILSNPDDFSEISVTKIPYPNEWGIGDFNILTNVWPMLDDVENLLYLELDDTLTVGYDLGGNIKKLFFPRTDWNQDTAYGQPIQNALFNPNPSVSHYYWFLPRVPIEYEQEIHHNYMVLYHDPLITISGGTLPSGVSVGQFDIIYHHNKPIYLDTAKNVPTVIYTKPYLDDYPSELVGVSFLNELNSFTVISPGGGMGVHDVRTFDLTDDLGLFPASGLSASGFLDRYVGVAGGHVGAVMFNSTFDREGGMFVPYAVIASGNFTHLDFTNNDPDPYIFVSASGISSSGIFLQRDKASSIWHDYSATLPSGVPITIIRADDRM